MIEVLLIWEDFFVVKKLCQIKTILINFLSKVVSIWKDFSIKLLMNKSYHIKGTLVLYW